MDFHPSDEQRMLADSVSRFVQDRYDLERRKTYLSSPESYCPENWRMLADLGITALALPGELGGFDGTPADIAMVMEQLGRGLVVEPVLPSAVIAARLLAASPAHAELATATAAGDRRIAVAFADPPASRPGPANRLRFEPADDGFRLNGVKTLAIQAVDADGVLFPCEGPNGFAVFLIEPHEVRGLVRKDYRLLDGSLASEFHFSDVEVPARNVLEVRRKDWASAAAWGNIAACAEMLGIMDRLLAETSDYLRTRKQFGVALGTFQAVQHQMAWMLIEFEKARALLLRATATVNAPQWPDAVNDCRHFIGRVAVELGEKCMHLHGGMGVTDELFAGNAHKRLILLHRLTALNAP